MNRLALLLAATISLVCHFASAIQFSLRPAEESCVSKDVIRGEYISGDFVVKPEGSRLSMFVRDSMGQTVYQKSSVSEGRFAYTAVDNGEYKACFNNNVEPGVKSVKLTMLTGVEAKPSGAAKKKNLKPLEVQVRHLEEVVAGIVNDEQWVNERQDRMRAVNDSTASYVFWFNILTITIAIGSYFIQLWYLKRFFRAKKLVVD